MRGKSGEGKGCKLTAGFAYKIHCNNATYKFYEINLYISYEVGSSWFLWFAIIFLKERVYLV